MAHGRLTGLAPPANLLSLHGWRHLIPVDAAEWRGQRSAYAASPGEAKPGASARGAVAGSDSRVLLGTRSFCRSPTVAARPSPQESGAFEAGVVPSLGGQPSRNRPLPMFLGDVLVPLAKCPVGPSSVAGAGGRSGTAHGVGGPATGHECSPHLWGAPSRASRSIFTSACHFASRSLEDGRGVSLTSWGGTCGVASSSPTPTRRGTAWCHSPRDQPTQSPVVEKQCK